MTKKIVVLDYGIGNVKSIINALDNLGIESVLSRDRKIILEADGLILPGVGAFMTGMANLKAHQLIQVINEYVNTNKPFLGICLGMQMLMEESEEFGNTKGLGLIKGKIQKMNVDRLIGERIPHVSWNEIKEPLPGLWKDSVLEYVNEGSDVYFVHSFVAVPDHESDILATCNYGNTDFCAAIAKGNVFGTQFHPEKSGQTGLLILKKFVELVKK